MFISFEGIDGSGKSTQARLLAEALRAEGRSVTLTREPGGSPGAEEIRRLLVEGDGQRWSPETELLLFNAARRDHWERTIRPALDAGQTVITDRFADSTRVYQGVARADLGDMVDSLHQIMIGVEPDVTFVIDVPLPVAARRLLQRAAAAHAGAAAAAASAAQAAYHAAEANRFHALSEVELEDRFESLGADFQERLRAGFFDLAARHPDRIRVIDGSGPTEAVAARVRAAL